MFLQLVRQKVFDPTRFQNVWSQEMVHYFSIWHLKWLCSTGTYKKPLCLAYKEVAKREKEKKMFLFLWIQNRPKCDREEAIQSHVRFAAIVEISVLLSVRQILFWRHFNLRDLKLRHYNWRHFNLRQFKVRQFKLQYFKLWHFKLWHFKFEKEVMLYFLNQFLFLSHT